MVSLIRKLLLGLVQMLLILCKQEMGQLLSLVPKQDKRKLVK